MEPFSYHVFVCDQKKPEGESCCAAKGSRALLEALQQEIAAQGLMDDVQVTPCGSLGLCEHGLNLIVYPEGIWYGGVRPEDAPEIVGSHFAQGIPVERLMRADTARLRAEILSGRHKREAALAAKNAAGALPDGLLQLVRGFQESRAVLTAIELDLFSAVGGGATAEAASAALQTDPRATETLLNAMAAVGLLTKRGPSFCGTETSARFLDGRSPDCAREALLHMANLWGRWSTLTECVRAGTACDGGESGRRSENQTRAFIAAMDRFAAERAPLVVEAVEAAGIRRMLDVGGGSAAYSIAFARAHEPLTVEVLDLPEVLPLAETHIRAAGMSGRIRTRPGDLRTDRLGSAFDLVLVSAICHMLGPDENLDLFRRCHEALAPQGRLVVQDFILDPDKTSPRFAAIFALNMLVGTPKGSTYSGIEYTEWMRAAGFGDVRHVRLRAPTGLIIGARA